MQCDGVGVGADWRDEAGGGFGVGHEPRIRQIGSGLWQCATRHHASASVLLSPRPVTRRTRLLVVVTSRRGVEDGVLAEVLHIPVVLALIIRVHLLDVLLLSILVVLVDDVELDRDDF